MKYNLLNVIQTDRVHSRNREEIFCNNMVISLAPENSEGLNKHSIDSVIFTR
jgi:hypothetical protein